MDSVKRPSPYRLTGQKDCEKRASRNSPSFAVAVNCGMGSSSLNADMKAFDRLRIVLDWNSSYIGSKYRSCTVRARCFGASSLPSTKVKPLSEQLQKAICDAVLLATCFYWKPMLCLQRSVCTARLLRRYGVAARVAIGFRPAPFFSHAWVEVDGKVVYGSAAYQQRLQMLVSA